MQLSCKASVVTRMRHRLTHFSRETRHELTHSRYFVKTLCCGIQWRLESMTIDANASSTRVNKCFTFGHDALPKVGVRFRGGYTCTGKRQKPSRGTPRTPNPCGMIAMQIVVLYT